MVEMYCEEIRHFQPMLKWIIDNYATYSDILSESTRKWLM